jgi:hypothetical protein
MWYKSRSVRDRTPSGSVSSNPRVLQDALVRDCRAALSVLHGQELGAAVAEAAELLAEVAGQDVEQGDDGCFRIARRVAPDRVISTVDVEARHGHKSHNRHFDGFKG